MNKSRVLNLITNRRNTRASNSLVDSDIRDLELPSGNRGKVLRTPPSRLLSRQILDSALRDLNPDPRVEISWGSDDVTRRYNPRAYCPTLGERVFRRTSQRERATPVSRTIPRGELEL